MARVCMCLSIWDHCSFELPESWQKISVSVCSSPPFSGPEVEPPSMSGSVVMKCLKYSRPLRVRRLMLLGASKPALMVLLMDHGSQMKKDSTKPCEVATPVVLPDPLTRYRNLDFLYVPDPMDSEDCFIAPFATEAERTWFSVVHGNDVIIDVVTSSYHEAP